MKEFIYDYSELIKDPDFIAFCKSLSFELNASLGKDLKEVETVKDWNNIFNSKKIVIQNNTSVSFNSIFIHGYKIPQKSSHPSGVRFDYLFGKTDQRELARVYELSKNMAITG